MVLRYDEFDALVRQTKPSNTVPSTEGRPREASASQLQSQAIFEQAPVIILSDSEDDGHPVREAPLTTASSHDNKSVQRSANVANAGPASNKKGKTGIGRGDATVTSIAQQQSSGPDTSGDAKPGQKRKRLQEQGVSNLISPITTTFEDTMQLDRDYEVKPAKPVLSPGDIKRPSLSNAYAGLVSANKRKTPVTKTTKLDEEGETIVEDEVRKPLERPHAPPKKPARGARPVYDNIQVVDTRRKRQTSAWYDSIVPVAKGPKLSRGNLTKLSYINTLLKACPTAPAQQRELEEFFTQIRTCLHEMEYFDFLGGNLIKKSKVLEDGFGLAQIMDNGGGLDFPWDIRDDAEMLYTKWMQGNLDPDPLRGIDSLRKTGPGRKGVTSHRMQADQKRVPANVHGSNNLHNGQWWPMQICALRDGAHGEIEAGIHGQPGKGAYSVIVGNAGYDDLDEGERILYCGTSGSRGNPSTGTNHLLDSIRLKKPVRVLRTSGLPASNQYRPRKGLRYDGLYDVVGFEILDEGTAMHRFELKRQPGQHPIRYEGEERRPTDQDVAHFSETRKLLRNGV